jgi:hypothetical protein
MIAKLFKFYCPPCSLYWDSPAVADVCDNCDKPAEVYCAACREFRPVESFDFTLHECRRHQGSVTRIPDELTLIARTLNGVNGSDQQRIAEVGIDWIQTLLAKNKDYGGSAWETPCLAPHIDVRDALFCRMSDKVKRIAALSSGATPKVNESLEDTVKDLGAYCLLWLARPVDSSTGATDATEH